MDPPRALRIRSRGLRVCGSSASESNRALGKFHPKSRTSSPGPSIEGRTESAGWCPSACRGREATRSAGTKPGKRHRPPIPPPCTRRPQSWHWLARVPAVDGPDRASLESGSLARSTPFDQRATLNRPGTGVAIGGMPEGRAGRVAAFRGGNRRRRGPGNDAEGGRKPMSSGKGCWVFQILLIRSGSAGPIPGVSPQPMTHQ